MNLRVVLFLILALASSAWADDYTVNNRASAKLSPNRGGTTVEDWRMIMPYWDRPAPETPNKWGAAFYAEFDSCPEGCGWLGIPSGGTYFQNSVELDYNWSKNTTIFVKPMWNTAYAPEGSKVTLLVSPGHTATKMGDTVVGLSQKKIFEWSGGGSFNAYARYYAPTGEFSRGVGQAGEVYARGNFDQPINSWLRGAFDAKFWYAIQTQDVYLDPNDSSQYKRTYDKEFLPYFSGIVTLSKHLKFFQSAGIDYTWMHGLYEEGAPTPTEFTALYLDSSIGTDFISKDVELRLGVSDTPSLNTGTSPALLQPGEYFYYFWLVLSI